MYNRYDGNTGRFVHVPDPEPPKKAPMTVQRQNKPGSMTPKPQSVRRPPVSPSPLAGIGDKLSSILPKLSLSELETEDIILLLILYLMYRESGDKDLLIMMASLLFL